MTVLAWLDRTRVRLASAPRAAAVLALFAVAGFGAVHAQTPAPAGPAPTPAMAPAGTAASAAASNSIEQVSVVKGASGRTVIKFTLKAPPVTPPAGFSISSPPRIALDFPDTTNALGTAQRAIEDGALRSLNVHWRRSTSGSRNTSSSLRRWRS